MNITKNGITVSFDEHELMRMALERLSADTPIIRRAPASIGEFWNGQGGIYAGIARGRDGQPDYHLIVGPEAHDALDWGAATQWAASVQVDGFTDFALPGRKQQALCFANVPELFKEEYYWSSEQHASDSDSAWCQYFYNGNQLYYIKDSKLRSRAVRRSSIRIQPS